MKPETKLGSQLQNFNRIAGVAHLIQAVVLFFILNQDTKIPVITRFFDETPQGIMPVFQRLRTYSSLRLFIFSAMSKTSPMA
jgi:hypothetical protein